jgi:hypothetical protein
MERSFFLRSGGLFKILYLAFVELILRALSIIKWHEDFESSHSWFNNLVAYRVKHQLGHGMDFQLTHDIGAVGFGCLKADPE